MVEGPVVFLPGQRLSMFEGAEVPRFDYDPRLSKWIPPLRRASELRCVGTPGNTHLKLKLNLDPETMTEVKRRVCTRNTLSLVVICGHMRHLSKFNRSADSITSDEKLA